VDLLQDTKKQVTSALGCPYQSSSHTTPDTSDSVWKVANKMREIGLDTFKHGRDGNDTAKKVVDVMALGEKRLKSSTLATFNKKVRRLHDGFVDEDAKLDVDEVPIVAMSFDAPDNVL
jgi:hypothetical protein